VTTIHPSSRRRRHRARRWPKVVAGLAGIVVVFAAGFGLGKALDDNPDPGPAVTTIQGLEALPPVPTTTG
jgi:drug/metabolite transporter (DMT)-like permease